jgi:hypothetical protein
MSDQAMKEAFADFAQGNFQSGLCKLAEDERWKDDDTTLDGPFYLGFPGAQGWGEGLLTASLLKRYAARSDKAIQVFAEPEVCSILRDDPAFRVQPVADFGEARLKGARSPLAILRRALTGDLLALPFERIGGHPPCHRQGRARPLIGMAWASVSGGNPIAGKSVPLEQFMTIFEDVHVDMVSFQRKLGEQDRMRIHDRFGQGCSVLSDALLDAQDQTEVVREVLNLDGMVTISTTTAHIAASFGIPVVLVTARRPYQQWFWRAQREYGKQFYPNVQVLLGSADERTWWKKCLETAKRVLSVYQ